MFLTIGGLCDCEGDPLLLFFLGYWGVSFLWLLKPLLLFLFGLAELEGDLRLNWEDFLVILIFFSIDRSAEMGLTMS